MKTEFKWNKPIPAIADEAAGGKSGLLFLANEAKRLMDPYVPADNLVLAQNVRVYVEDDKGIVHYTSPYAHYQYAGEMYVDPVTKKGAFTDGQGRFWSRPGVAKVMSGKLLNYNTFRHPLATFKWNEAMFLAHKGDLSKAYQNYLKKEMR